MAAYRDSHSRLISWLKIVLPLAAIAILSTLFLVSPRPDLSRALPLARSSDDIRRIARTEGIGNPSFSGITDNGFEIAMTAKRAIPEGADGADIRANDLSVDLTGPSGIRIHAEAPEGKIYSASRQGLLAGGVHVTTSTGYQVSTETLRADFIRYRAETLGPIEASGPLGSFSAGKMLIRQKPQRNGKSTYELVFTDGVHLVYTPRK